MASTEHQGLSVAVSNAVVSIVRDYTGRGPTAARTEISDHLITCTLGDGLTKGERRLVEHGREDHVLQTRVEFQNAMGDDLTAAVEEITGRRVLAYMSANHINPDLGIEAFVMQPPPDQTTPT
jgi:uncharacterized protein YbcI